MLAVSGATAVLLREEGEAKRPRHGRMASHRPGKDKDNRKGKRKGKHKKGGSNYFSCGTPDHPADQGRPCGKSSHGGTTLRCCNGTCPDRACHTSGFTGLSCENDGQCSSLDCCNDDFATCVVEEAECFCIYPHLGEPCASDQDCGFDDENAICVCGTCRLP